MDESSSKGLNLQLVWVIFKHCERCYTLVHTKLFEVNTNVMHKCA